MRSPHPSGTPSGGHMIAAGILARAILAMALLRDGNGAPIPRHEEWTRTVANVAIVATSPVLPGFSDTDRARFWMVLLDVWGAYESGYGGATFAGGCPGVPNGTPCRRDQGARYCGPWGQSCNRVPRGSTLSDLARIAIRVFGESFAMCPEFPLSIYSAGDCRRHRLVDWRLTFVRREYATPFPSEPTP